MSLAYVLTCYPWVLAQPGIDRLPVYTVLISNPSPQDQTFRSSMFEFGDKHRSSRILWQLQCPTFRATDIIYLTIYLTWHTLIHLNYSVIFSSTYTPIVGWLYCTNSVWNTEKQFLVALWPAVATILKSLYTAMVCATGCHGTTRSNIHILES